MSLSVRTGRERRLRTARTNRSPGGYSCPMGSRWVFDGHIAGIGTASGLRAVVGIWQESPFWPFADVMVQQPSGHRQLLAPSREVAEFIAATYTPIAVLTLSPRSATTLLAVIWSAALAGLLFGVLLLLFCRDNKPP